MSSFNNLTSSQKCRAAVHQDVRSICTETCHFLGLEITKPAMEIVAELVYKKLSVYGTDLEAFAKHAKRTTITSDDVKLLVRRNPSLKTHLNSIAPIVSTVKDKRRKTVALPVNQPDTPTPKQKEEMKTKDPEPLVQQQMEETAEDMVVDADTIDLTFD